MPFRPISRFVLRAPLLPVRALADAPAELARHPLGPMAVELASPDLAAALAAPGRGRAAALDRYARRAAFRPTPAGLLAGVAMGELGPRTRIATGAVEAWLAPGWAAMAGLGRALLDDPALRAHVRLRSAPSLLAGGGDAVWLAMHADGLQVGRAELDEELAAVLAATSDWSAWPVVRKAVAAVADADEWLLALVDGGLLHHDLTPPLVGPPPGTWMLRRLDALPSTLAKTVAPLRSRLAQALAAEDAAAARAALAELPGTDAARSVQAVLRHRPAALPALSRRAVERAATLAPVLFRLQEALAGPVAERACEAALLDALHGMAEVFGAGALDVPALATGGYGEMLAESDDEPATPRPDRGLLAWLAEAVSNAARAGAPAVELDADLLAALLPPLAVPPSFELCLTPAREPPGAPPGTGWLLGVHAPAGASWGRFAAALGAPCESALAEIAEAELQTRPGVETLDVAFAPSAALADLCVHPTVRQRALALVGWPEAEAVAPCELALAVDPAHPEPLALRDGADRPVAPSPLHRVRSTTAPAGLYRLLAGWSLCRQHAPWAFSWGPLAGLPFLPRVVLDGFAVAPASWRIPDAAACREPRALGRWRRDQAVPRAVQVGQGDELLYLDLGRRGAGSELARFAGGRAFEIWPPFDRLPDRGGRRVEAVVAVVANPDAVGADVQAGHAAPGGRVAPPAEQGPAADWHTFKLFGAPERQHLVLHDAVGPAVRAGRAAGEIDRWFFLPYLDGQRHHLRVRAHATSKRAGFAFARRLRSALRPLRASGAVVAVETADYFRESARYGGLARMPAVEAIFEAGSELGLHVLGLEAAGHEVDRLLLAVRACEALTRGLGLDLAERRRLARSRRSACEQAGLAPAPELLRAEYRTHARTLAAQLSGAARDPLTPALARLEKAAAMERAAPRGPAQVLGTLLHVQCVRLAGPWPHGEAAAYVLWERTLESLAARQDAGGSARFRPLPPG